jgi:hypothetical protein
MGAMTNELALWQAALNAIAIARACQNIYTPRTDNLDAWLAAEERLSADSR